VNGPTATGRRFASCQSHWFRVENDKLAEHWATREDLPTMIRLGVIQRWPMRIRTPALSGHPGRSAAPSDGCGVSTWSGRTLPRQRAEGLSRKKPLGLQPAQATVVHAAGNSKLSATPSAATPLTVSALLALATLLPVADASLCSTRVGARVLCILNIVSQAGSQQWGVAEGCSATVHCSDSGGIP